MTGKSDLAHLRIGGNFQIMAASYNVVHNLSSLAELRGSLVLPQIIHSLLDCSDLNSPELLPSSLILAATWTYKI